MLWNHIVKGARRKECIFFFRLKSQHNRSVMTFVLDLTDLGPSRQMMMMMMMKLHFRTRIPINKVSSI